MKAVATAADSLVKEGYLLEPMPTRWWRRRGTALCSDKEKDTNKQRLFLASCVSLVTTSMVFAIRGDIAAADERGVPAHQRADGADFQSAFWAFTIAIFISGALVDALGMRALHILSAIGYFLGIGLILLAPLPTAPVASIFGETGTLCSMLAS